MKKLLLILIGCAFHCCALAQGAPPVYGGDIVNTTVPASKMIPQGGVIRNGPCANGAGQHCGNNPPVWHIDPTQCNQIQSTSNARNEDGSQSTGGVAMTMPLVSEFLSQTVPYTPNTADGRCHFEIVMGAPGGNYLILELFGVSGTDKFTTFAQAAYDGNWFRLVLPYRSPGIVACDWNGTSILCRGTPNVEEELGLGQLASHGQGRLFLVTADPVYNTTGSNIGKIAFCQYQGNGFVSNSNGGWQLSKIPYACIFHAPTSGSANEWLTVGNNASGVVMGVTAGASYGSFTAPDGESCAAGIYPVVNAGSFPNDESGNLIELQNIHSTLSSIQPGKYLHKLLDVTDIEVHEQVTPLGIGCPPNWTGDTWTSGGNFDYMFLATASGGTAPEVNPSTGITREATLHIRTVGGFAKRTSGAYTDTATNRLVASLFNPEKKKCISTFSVDRTPTADGAWHEINSEIRCNFVFLGGVPSISAGLGDVGQRRVDYVANITASNATNAAGCQFAVGIDGTTPESETPGFTNLAGSNGDQKNVTVSGSVASSLTETNHYLTLLANCTAASSPTVVAAKTTLEFTVWQ